MEEELLNQKAAIYIRVSTAYQIDKDSLQVQRRELVAYADMVLGIKDYEIFEDPGFSAKNTDRPAYQLMMSRLRTGEFSHLLVWKIDRISRNLLDFTEMYNELKKLGVTFVSKNERFDTSSAIGEAMLKIILVFAELERQMTAERVTAVMLSRANNGQWNGGKVIFGYNYDKTTKTFSINEEEAKIVRLVWDLYEEKRSILYVVKKFNAEGLKSRGGNNWTTISVDKILTNRFYTGVYIYNMRDCSNKSQSKKPESDWIIIPNHHPAIIDEQRFDRIQYILKKNRRGARREGKSRFRKNVHIFAGLCKCGMCGSGLRASLDRCRADGWRPSQYVCYKRREDPTTCTNKYISDVTLGPFVFNFVANILRISASTAERLTVESLKDRLVSGDPFLKVDHIEGDLEKLLNILRTGDQGVEYKLLAKSNADVSTQPDEREILGERRAKDENALSRLHNLYLFSESGLSEKDYIIQRQSIIDDMNKIDARLAEIIRNDADSISENEDSVRKASYFIMVDQLLSSRTVDYRKYISKLDPDIPRNFLLQILDHIEVLDGKVTEIEFLNGVKLRFIYA